MKRVEVARVAGFFERRRLRAFAGPIEAVRRAFAGSPAHALLDVGGGSGAISEEVGGGVERIVVLEPRASARDKGKRVRPSLEFVDGRAERIPFPDASFDRVLATGSLHHFADPAAGLSEMRRVLTEGGKLVIFECSPEKGHGVFLVRFACHSSLKKPEQLREMVEAAGFAAARIEELPPGFLIVASRSP